MAEPISPLHIILIDDEEIDRRIYARVLKRAGLAEDPVGFSYAADALAYLADPAVPPVDLILLDINMPGMNGFEFLEVLTSMEAGTPDTTAVAIMLTTSLNPRDMERATAFPAVKAFLGKPLNSRDVSDVIEKIGRRAVV